MGKTTLMNNAESSVQVVEGNSNIFRILQVLKPGDSMTIQADSKATYREYVLILLPENKDLRPLSATDIQEFRAIEIFCDKETRKVNWKGTERKSWVDFLLRRSSPKPGNEVDPALLFSGVDPLPVFTEVEPIPVFTGVDSVPVCTGADPIPVCTGADPAPVSNGGDPAPVSNGGDPTPVSMGGDPAPVSTADDPTTGSMGVDSTHLIKNNTQTPANSGSSTAPQ